jgi:hypothetical protein
MISRNFHLTIAFVMSVIASTCLTAKSADGLFFGQTPPTLEPAMFSPDILTKEKHPHSALNFSPDCNTLFWSAMLADGPEQTLFFSTFDGKTISKPMVAPFAADSGNGGPSISQDGNRLFFNADIPYMGNPSKTASVICFVEKTASGWNKPTPIPATVDTLMNKGQVTIARSGNIYFSGRIYSERMPAIFKCKFENGKYLLPEKVTFQGAFPGLMTDPWVDPDERFMLLAASRPGGSPMVTDICISYPQKDGTWGSPINLGDTINTVSFERFPSMSRDGKYLFFIRSLNDRFVGDKAHFYWVDAKILERIKK